MVPGNQCLGIAQNGVVFTPAPCQMPFWNMSLVGSTKQRTAPELTNKTVCLRRPGAHFCGAPSPCPNFIVGYLKKESVLTLVPGEYRTRAPCADTRCARCPSYFLKRSNDLSIKARLLSQQISPFNWTKSYSQKRRPKFPKLF